MTTGNSIDSTTTAAVAAGEPAGPNLQDPDRVTVEKLKVLHDYIVVRSLAVPSKMAGALLHMPDTAGEREKSHRGIVIAMGPGDFNEPGTALVPMTLEVGDLVFFGKYAGTEERVGTDVVLVMREQECRFCVPEGKYKLVTHDDPKLDHLVEDYCEVCHGVPEEQAAAERLALEREARQLQLHTLCATCAHAGDRHAHGTGSCHDCECQGFTQTPAPLPEFPSLVREAGQSEIDEVNEQLLDLDRRNKLGSTWPSIGETMFAVTAVSDDRRPCSQPGCLLMQRRVTVNDREVWVGLRCGHVTAPEVPA